MTRKKIITTAVLTAAVLWGCGGGGGASSNESSFTPTNITTQGEAKKVSSSGLKTIKEITSIGETGISTASKEAKLGLLKAVLKVTNGGITPQSETRSCNNGGTVVLEQTGENSASIQFNNCQPTECETLNGRVYASFSDNNNNGIIENASLTFENGFSYENSCDSETINVGGDFSISMVGKLPGGDIYDDNDRIKADLIFNGGEVLFRKNGKEERASFFQLDFYENESDPVDADIEYSINGGFVYSDNYCLNDTVSVIFQTQNIFKEYEASGCPYTGKLVINGGQVTVEAYDNDGNNKIRIYLGNDMVYDESCSELENLDVCPE